MMKFDKRMLVLGLIAGGVMTTAVIIRAQEGVGPNSASEPAMRNARPPRAAHQPPPPPGGMQPPPGTSHQSNWSLPSHQVFPATPHLPPHGVATIHQGFHPERFHPVQDDAIHMGVRAVQAAESDEKRQAATAKLRQTLVVQFKADVQRRQEELEAIEARLKEMRTKLDKRIESADQIIDLRLQVLLQDADGLGWSGPGMHRVLMPVANDSPIPAYRTHPNAAASPGPGPNFNRPDPFGGPDFNDRDPLGRREE
jgi:hypothetical protein